jgi:hypothetical protein
MAEMSNYLENALINATLRNTSYTSPATVYVGLYTTDPTDADTGTEVSGGSYARTAVTFGAPSNGVTLNSAAVEFPQATGHGELWLDSVFLMLLQVATCCITRHWTLLRRLTAAIFSRLLLVA